MGFRAHGNYRYQEIEEGELQNSLRKTEQRAQYGIHLSATHERILADRVQAIIMHQSTLEECVVKVVKENGEEKCS